VNESKDEDKEVKEENETGRDELPPEPVETPEESSKALVFTVIALLLLVGLVWWGFRSQKAGKAQGGTPLAAATTPGESVAQITPDPIIATVDGMAINQSDLEAAYESIPENMRNAALFRSGRQQMIEELVRMKLLEREAGKLGVDRSPAVKGRIHIATGNILANAALEKLVESNRHVTLEQLYEKRKTDFESAKARQILVAYQGGVVPSKSGKALTEAEARARAEKILAELRGGADFEKVARAESDDPGVAKTGGDIGEVGHDLPADIDKVIFSIPLNQFSEPVRSQYGYHVFQVMSRSTKPFSEVKPIMERSEDRLRAREVIEDLRKKAKVDFAPGFGPASRAPGAQ
jgi:Parvulin-like peptidyl-prolyl isomerase